MLITIMTCLFIAGGVTAFVLYIRNNIKELELEEKWAINKWADRVIAMYEEEQYYGKIYTSLEWGKALYCYELITTYDIAESVAANYSIYEL